VFTGGGSINFPKGAEPRGLGNGSAPVGSSLPAAEAKCDISLQFLTFSGKQKLEFNDQELYSKLSMIGDEPS